MYNSSFKFWPSLSPPNWFLLSICWFEYLNLTFSVILKGCKGIDGKCVKQGDTRRYECTDYVCDTSRGGLVITGQGIYVMKLLYESSC